MSEKPYLLKIRKSISKVYEAYTVVEAKDAVDAATKAKEKLGIESTDFFEVLLSTPLDNWNKVNVK